ncbi:MAG TPA: polysaccharide deacetylase family protein [Tepidisphaeraceae bacterium]|jgi:peptidoglycan/xylan/chitin deacetylase (PgdA/CDA1 family)
MTGVEISLSTLAAVTAVAGPASYATFRPRCAWWGQVLSHGTRSGNAISLTFDDGPTPPYTSQILDILAHHRVKATFFVVGDNARNHPDILRRMHAEGHEIGNHTTTHPHYGWLRGATYWHNQIQETDDIVREAVGQSPRFFRPPLGFKNPLTLQAARCLNKQTIAWTCRAFDGLANPPETIHARLLRACPGDILLLHDGITSGNPSHNPTPTVQALSSVIQDLKSKNLQLVPLTQLLHRQ